MQIISGCSRLASLVLAALLAAATISLALFAQPGTSSFIPDNAVVIERARIAATVHPDRELVLWMVSPAKHDRGALAENPYTCPELTLGSYYSGPTRLSLLDTRSGRVINTVKLMSSISDDKDEFNIPYRIVSGQYYPETITFTQGNGMYTILEWNRVGFSPSNGGSGTLQLACSSRYSRLRGF